ncbi:hypothetical protein HYQ40_08845 [Aerococcaceae bacterium DSM 111021]|nr:hypothetical protein [Aerococcaceae bacterium DSM 111021]
MVLYKHNELLTFFDRFTHTLSNRDSGTPVYTDYYLIKDSISMLLHLDVFEDKLRLYHTKNDKPLLDMSNTKVSIIKKENNSLIFLNNSDTSTEALKMEFIFEESVSVRIYNQERVKQVDKPIQYDTYDMLELFWMEEDTIKKTESHHIVQYTRTINEVTINFRFDILQNTVEIEIFDQQHVYLTSFINNISKLTTEDNMLTIYRQERAIAKIFLNDKVYILFENEFYYD